MFGMLTPFVLTEFITFAHRPPNDYFAFYSFSRFVHDYPAASIYDIHLLERLQLALRGRFFPYLYDPGMLLLVWPLGYLPFAAGWLCWIGLGLAAYIAALGAGARDRTAALAALVAPSTLWTTMCGQTALFGAGLLLGGFRLLPGRPVPAGILFGLLTYKPQLAVLVPVALAAASEWRCLLATCITAAVFMLASAAAFGCSAWSAWLLHLPALGHIVGRDMLVLCPLMATVTSNLLVFGVPATGAHIVQLVVAIAACVAVWSCLRTGVTMLGAAAVAVATFLVTPYAFAYDMPLLTGAVIVIASEAHRRDEGFAFWEVMVLLAGFLLPFCVVIPVFFRFSSLVVAALLWLIVRRVSAASGTTIRAFAGGRPALAQR